MSDQADVTDSLRGELRQLEELVKLPAMIKIFAELQAEIDTMQNSIVMSPVRDAGDVYVQEYRKGQIEGRLAIATSIENRIETLRYEINQQKEKLYENEG